jgi:E3 ubiquitin-protein ligase HUWE1
MPCDLANSLGSDSIIQVIRSMVKVPPNETLNHFTLQVKYSLDGTRVVWESLDNDSQFLPLNDLEGKFFFPLSHCN